ncbi:hypothetical protein MRX96_022321 [Rhipicephalus microplus]
MFVPVIRACNGSDLRLIYDCTAENLNYKDLMQLCDQIFDSLIITQQACESIETRTRSQALSANRRFKRWSRVLHTSSHAVTRAWGSRVGNGNGAQVIEFAAAAGLVVINDLQSEPTYETAYATRWIDLTLATPSVPTAQYTWITRSDVTHSEHRKTAARKGSDEGGAHKCLTRCAQQILRVLERKPWSARAIRSKDRFPEALYFIVGAFCGTSNKHL